MKIGGTLTKHFPYKDEMFSDGEVCVVVLPPPRVTFNTVQQVRSGKVRETTNCHCQRK